MVKGHVTSATVVPTAGEEVETPSSLSSQLLDVVDGDEGSAYSSEGEGSNAGALATTQPQADMFLQVAFSGQAASQAAANAAESAALPVRPLEMKTSAATDSAASSLVSKGRQCSLSAMIEKKDSTKLTKNYQELAKTFRQLQPFTRLPDGTYPSNTRCVFCGIARPTSVLFPCQHMCVCNDCIYAHNMSPDYSQFSEWCVCPVCMTDIRLILPHSGTEEDKYWKWVMEVKPTLPTHFKQNFKESGKRLRYSFQGGEGAKVPVAARRGSIFQNKPNATSKGPSPSQNRRHTWQPGAEEAEAVHNLAASNEHEVAKNCVIL